jgi:hypothetical protein
MSAKTSYVIRLSEDSNNNFLTTALPNLPIYALGGDLPLSDDTRNAAYYEKPSNSVQYLCPLQ